MAEKKKAKPMLTPSVDNVVRPGAAGAALITGLASKLKSVTPKPPKKKTPTW